MKLIEDIRQFFKKNWIGISLVVVGLFLILSIVAVKNIQFKRHPDKTLEKILLYEKFRGREGFKEGIITAKKDTAKKDTAKKDTAKKDTSQDAPSGVLKVSPGSSDVGSADDPEFCKRTEDDLENACKSLLEGDCKTTDCCIWATPKSGKPMCMAGDENGPTVDEYKKPLDEWWYKGPINKQAIKYPRKYTNFKEAMREPIPGRKPLKNTESAILIEEKAQEAHDDIVDTREQATIVKQNRELARAKMTRDHERRALEQKHTFAQEWETLNNVQEARKVQAGQLVEKVQQQKILDATNKLKEEEKKLDEERLQKAINDIAAEGVGEGTSTTDKAESAKAGIKIDRLKKDTERRELANQAIYQGELAGGEKINTTDGKSLGLKMAPDSASNKKTKVATLLAAQKMMKTAELQGDMRQKAAAGILGLKDIASQMTENARAGFTNYFKN